ncbi:MAG: xanthine dehydrogenase family protein subunit M [Chloroflexota bacterium]|nr:xanthine dehydrogenase family protein subunit M [Chloroflexota bacterium]
MRDFSYIRAASIESAVAALNSDDGVSLVAGGTDLVPLLKDELATPRALVDISGLPGLDYVEEKDGRLHIGAMTTLSRLASHPLISERYTALAQACRLAATPQLRNMSTIAGNLLQQPRCWYYRGEHNCWLKGGEICYARNGENELHAILKNSPGESRCVSVHPSDPAVALLLFDSSVRIRTSEGETELPLLEFYNVPTPERRNGAMLPPGAVITGISLAPADGGRSIYPKAMPRATWAFALVSVGIHTRVSRGRIEDARVALGGAAPVPVRLPDAEALLVRQEISEVDARAFAESVAAAATPLAKNAYKVALLKGLLKQALSQVLSQVLAQD